MDFLRGSKRNDFSATLFSAVTALVGSLVFIVGCAETLPSKEFNSSVLGRKYLYVASGTCYTGGVTASTGSSTVAKFDLSTGTFSGLVVDYNGIAPGDQPAALQRYSGDQFLVAIENTAGRRVDILKNDGSGLTTYLTNTTALNGILRSLVVLPDASILLAKVTAIEKFSPSRSRVLQGAVAYVNNPGGACAASNTAISSMITLPNGKIVYTHAAATPNNKIGVISATGYAAGADCLAAETAPITTARPTSVAYHQPSGKLLVTYGSTTSASNSIYSYDIDLDSGAISGATLAWQDTAIVYGPSEIAVDSSTGDIFVANGASTYNNIEKFSLNSDGELEKVGTTAFIGTNVYTRCVSGMEIAP